MRIKLISPRMSLRPMDSEYKRKMSPSLALLVLASLTENKHKVYMEDENIEDLRLNDNPDLVGITVNVETSYRAYEIAASYRIKNIPVVLGGIHPSAMPDEALKYCDAVCIGEAESLWQTILYDVENKSLKPKYYSISPEKLINSPPPKWSLIKQQHYLYTNIAFASRGCPHACMFCYNSCDYVHHKFRNKNVSQITKEIELLQTKHIMFIDDNFIGNPSWTKDFTEAIKIENLKWNCAVSTDLINHPDLLDAMAESGCKSVFIGFESINSGSINSVSKSQNRIDKYEKLISMIHERGIMINASLAFGFDHDQVDVFQNTLDWLVSNRIETMTAHILTPYPGTKLFAIFEKDKRIIDYDWRHYNTAHVVFEPQKMSKQELYQGYLWIYDQFYSFKNIIKRMPKNKNQWMPYLLFNFGYRKFGRITSALGKSGFMGTIGRISRRLSYGID